MLNRILRKQYSSIPLHVVFYLAWRNLATKKLRTLLTVLGVVIGIGAIFFLLSIGIGLQNLVTNELIGSQSVKAIDVTTANSRIVKLDDNVLERIEGLAHVDKAGASYAAPGIVKYGGSESSGPIYGVDTTYQELSNLTLKSGHLLDEKSSETVIVSTSKLKSMGGAKEDDIIDKNIELVIPIKLDSGEQSAITKNLKVIGVVDTGGESAVFVPNDIFLGANVNEYTQIKLIADDVANIANLRRQVESMGLETTSPVDTLDQINQIFKYFNVVLVGFGAIGMIVAVLGMFNTLTISLLERTKEIGLMLALGARRKDMRRLFVCEATLLSLIGSVVGIAGAITIGKIVNIAMNKLAQSRGVSEGFTLFATPLWLVVGLIGFMVLVGLGVVFFPARRAEHINPIDALRRE